MLGTARIPMHDDSQLTEHCTTPYKYILTIIANGLVSIQLKTGMLISFLL